MSYSSFTKDLNDEIAALNSDISAPVRVDFETVHRRVFDRWLAQGRHEGLVKYLISNLDGAEGGEEWMRLLGDALATKNRPDLIQKLYGPVISLRRNHYFWRRARLKTRWPIPRFLDPVLSRVTRNRRKLAKYKQSVLALMRDQRRVMSSVKEADLSVIDREIAAFARADVPKRKIVPIASQTMNERAFWALIADVRASGAAETEVAPIVEASLGTLQPHEIERFESILRELLDRAYRWDLWAVAYAVAAIAAMTNSTISESG
jgi:hypothetical protein